MSKDHQILITGGNLSKLELIQSIIAELQKDDNVYYKETKVNGRLDAFNLYFSYKEELRTIFICEMVSVYEDIYENPISPGGLYLSIGVWGLHNEVMDLVKDIVIKNFPVIVYERTDDSVQDLFTQVV